MRVYPIHSKARTKRKDIAAAPLLPSLGAIADFTEKTSFTFVHDAASSITRTPQDKARDLYSVRDAGAPSDGATDARAAFAVAAGRRGLAIIPFMASGYAFSSPLANTQGAFLPDPMLTWDELTDAGKFDWGTPDAGWTYDGVINDRHAATWRFADRVLVGEAACRFAADSSTDDGGTSWMSDATTAPSYLGVNAQLLSTARFLPYAVVAASRGSDVNGNNPIGFGAAVINNVAGKNAWGGIIEMQHEIGASLSLCWEIGAKFKSAGPSTALNAYNNGAGVMGLWFAGGGDSAFGGAATHPSNTAMVVLRNNNAGAITAGWQRALVVKSNALDGTDGSAGSSGTGVAIALARRHAIDWGAPTDGGLGTGAFGFRIVSSVVDATNAVQIVPTDSTIQFLDRSGNVFFSAIDGGNDYLLTRSSTGQGRLDAAGASTNADVYLVPKGTGNVKFGTHTASADAAVSGYITIKDSTGATRKLAVIT